MSEKVALPREVAEAIEELRSDEYSNWAIMHQAHGAVITDSRLVLKRWAFAPNGEGTPDLLMQALVNGYEIERNPHEELRKFYDNMNELRGKYGYKFDHGVIAGVKRTLQILDITVEGINDTNTSTDAT